MSTDYGNRVPDPLPYLKPVASLLGLVVLWTALESSGAIGDLPGPTPVATAAVELLPSSRLHEAVIASFTHIYVPYALAAVIGVPLGLSLGWSLTFRDLVFPALELLRPVPPIAWIPIAILVLPTTTSSIMFITFLGAFFPIVLNGISGVRDVEEDHVRAVRSLGGSSVDVLRQVVFPSALPSIHTGLVVGMGLAWVNLVAAEMIADQGLGRFVWVSYTSSAYSHIVFGVVLIGCLGYASSEVVRWLGNRRLRWMDRPG